MGHIKRTNKETTLSILHPLVPETLRLQFSRFPSPIMSTRALTEHNQLACPFVSEISPGDQIDLIVLTIQCWLLLKSLTLSKSRAQTLDALLKHSRMFSSFAFWLLARSTAGGPKHLH